MMNANGVVGCSNASTDANQNAWGLDEEIDFWGSVLDDSDLCQRGLENWTSTC